MVGNKFSAGLTVLDVMDTQTLAEAVRIVQQWLATQGLTYLLRGLGAIVLFIIGRWVASLFANTAARALRRSHVDETLVRFVLHAVELVVIVAVVLACLDLVGVQTTSIVAMIGAAGLAIGLAMQGSLSNFAAGMLIIFFRPFRVGDFIAAADASGLVEEISIFTTQLRTSDHRLIVVPNSRVTAGNIVNFMSRDARRIELTVLVSYEDGPATAKAAIERALKADPRVLAEPKPLVGVNKLGDSGLEFAVWVWAKVVDEIETRFALNEAILRELETAGCWIPTPAITWLGALEPSRALKQAKQSARK